MTALDLRPVPSTSSSGTNVGNEKLMFKLAAGTAGSDHHPKSGLGYGSPHNAATKVEDDIKLDFTFETADMTSHTGDDKGTPDTSSKLQPRFIIFIVVVTVAVSLQELSAFLAGVAALVAGFSTS